MRAGSNYGSQDLKFKFILCIILVLVFSLESLQSLARVCSIMADTQRRLCGCPLEVMHL